MKPASAKPVAQLGLVLFLFLTPWRNHNSTRFCIAVPTRASPTVDTIETRTTHSSAQTWTVVCTRGRGDPRAGRVARARGRGRRGIAGRRREYRSRGVIGVRRGPVRYGGCGSFAKPSDLRFLWCGLTEIQLLLDHNKLFRRWAGARPRIMRRGIRARRRPWSVRHWVGFGRRREYVVRD